MKRIAGLFALAGAAAVASAQTPAMVDFTGGSAFDSYYGSASGDVVGYRFTADVDMTVTHLGGLDADSSGAMDSDHIIGIWRDSDQALLGSVTVTPSSPLTGEWRYEPVAGVNLVAGERYTAGMLYFSGDGDSYYSSPSSVTLDGISNTVAVFPAAAELGFSYPENESAGNRGRIGPNFLWVPAPSSLALLGLGGLVAARRRR